VRPHVELEHDLLRLCRRLRDHCQYLEIRVEESRSADFSFAGPDLESINRRFERGGSARALVDGAWGFATFNSLDDVEDMSLAAIAQARLIGGGPVTLAPVEPVVDRVEAKRPGDEAAQPLAARVERLRGLNDTILRHGRPITTSAAHYAERRVGIWLATSDGTALFQERLDVTAGLVAIAAADGAVQRRGFSTGSSADPGLPTLDEAAAERVATECAALTTARKPEAGVYIVVVDPRLAGTFAHEAIGHLSEADHIDENPRLREVMTLGSEMGPAGLDIYDTGLVEGSRGALRYDEEGVPGERTELIKSGRLVGRLHSRETAGVMGERPTGNARAISYRAPPIVRMRTTCIGPGSVRREDLFKGIRRGLYCVESQGGQTDMEMFTFSAALGYLIEDGEPGELVRDVTLTGNTFKTLRDIEAIENVQTAVEAGGGCGKAGQGPLPVGFAAPHLRIREVRIGGD
jgi:TldD protein